MCLLFSSLSEDGEGEQLGSGWFFLVVVEQREVVRQFSGAEEEWLSVPSLLRVCSVDW